LRLHEEAGRELAEGTAGVEQRGRGGKVAERAHRLVEGERPASGILLLERDPHGDAHPEELRRLQELVSDQVADEVALLQGEQPVEPEGKVPLRAQGSGEAIEVEVLHEASRQQAALDTSGDVVREAASMRGLQV